MFQYIVKNYDEFEEVSVHKLYGDKNSFSMFCFNNT